MTPVFNLAAAVSYNDRMVDYRTPETAGMIAKLVAAYQAEHGLIVDGKLGPATRAALDQISQGPSVVVAPPTAASSDLVRAALERMERWALDICYYDLGAGGSAKAPAWPGAPWNEQRQVDCSAAVCGALGFARNDGDWNTTKILRDALRRDGSAGPETRFLARRRPADVRPGDVLVKDGIFDPKTGKRLRPGHISLVMSVPPGFDWNDPNWWKGIVIGHSSPANSAPPPKGRGTGHAIGLTNAMAFRVAGDLDHDGDVDPNDNVAWWASNNVAFLAYLPFQA